ncbi:MULTISPECIES: stage V sporulation protein E [Clostridium]|uniref:Probable peptidoglycan glycosyltransferase FtsW n=1 Tax=Clostridium novyi (strain NT) TaxID=386415 RepID=A0Q061_CLONN|nr:MULTISPECIES: stage V sporulation protein E [Clostridium]ABK61451.1 stage V sporulation protein E [Clostridium novyi NT]KEH85504.1 stage V sporulation protein E [Clostridium novyi A str. NCTC 538]KEH86532.1 stage V sporulation protein E [Clostridium novyi A str. BKT29909]KEH87912.1 stage V sporulation protein E [Clostridium novyi A str. 4540]KEH93441.1 stage V sporulation protein E [Clostridium botulinum C/D str. It1]
MENPKKKLGKVDFILFITIMLLVSIGVIMVYSASSYASLHNKNYNYDSMYFLKKQGLWAFIGLICMVVAEKTDYHKLRKNIKPLIIVTIILLCAVFAFPGNHGARRWIYLPGGASIQPSEIAKYVVVLYMANSIEQKGEKMKTFKYGVFPYLIVSGFFAGMVLLEKNLSIASVIMIVTLIILFASGCRGKHIAFVFGLIGVAGSIFTVFESYRLRRLVSFLNPWADPRGDGYQLIQSLLALGSGGVMGMGLGRSRQKCYYIPEPHNDFIFSIIGEELGLIGCLVVIALFILFMFRGIRTAVRAKDVFGTVLATGITGVIAIQAIINIAVVTGSMPVTGVPLPFISYGGSSLVFNLIAMGVLLNISRQSN